MLEYKSTELIFKVSDKEWDNLNKVNKLLGYLCLSESIKFLIDDNSLIYDISCIENDLIEGQIISQDEVYSQNIKVKLSNNQLNELTKLKNSFKAEDEADVLRILINNNFFVNEY
jgi:hypothetical protein